MISLVITLIIVGVLLYLVNQIQTIDPTIKVIIRWVVILATLLYVAAAFGVYDIGIPRLR